MDVLIDRRAADVLACHENKRRYLRKALEQITDEVIASLTNPNRSITSQKAVPVTLHSWPLTSGFSLAAGRQEIVHAGNKDYVRGARMPRPSTGPAPEAVPDELLLTYEQALHLYCGDLPPPFDPARQRSPFMRPSESNSEDRVFTRTSRHLDLVKSHRAAMGLRIATHHRHGYPLDPDHLVERGQARQPKEIRNLVIFLLKDKIYNSNQNIELRRLDIARRFCTLLTYFMKSHYDRIELSFLLHKDSPVCTEESFFSPHPHTHLGDPHSALKEAERQLDTCYPSSQWDSMMIESSGGNFERVPCYKAARLLDRSLLNRLNYFLYIQTAGSSAAELTRRYEPLRNHHGFHHALIDDTSQIPKVFRDTFLTGGQPKPVAQALNSTLHFNHG